MKKKYIKICEKLDWTIHEYEDCTVELEKYSPAGEDFSFTVDSKDFVQNVKDYTLNFDIDEHIEMWVEARKNGVNGIPSIRRLVDDAEAIYDMLEELWLALEEDTYGCDGCGQRFNYDSGIIWITSSYGLCEDCYDKLNEAELENLRKKYE